MYNCIHIPVIFASLLKLGFSLAYFYKKLMEKIKLSMPFNLIILFFLNAVFACRQC